VSAKSAGGRDRVRRRRHRRHIARHNRRHLTKRHR
jgi:hypothetical protein